MFLLRQFRSLPSGVVIDAITLFLLGSYLKVMQVLQLKKRLCTINGQITQTALLGEIFHFVAISVKS